MGGHCCYSSIWVQRPFDAECSRNPNVDVLEEWKRKFRLDPKLSVRAQLRLSEANKPNTRKPHTFLLTQLKEILTYPGPDERVDSVCLRRNRQARRQGN